MAQASVDDVPGPADDRFFTPRMSARMGSSADGTPRGSGGCYSARADSARVNDGGFYSARGHDTARLADADHSPVDSDATGPGSQYQYDQCGDPQGAHHNMYGGLAYQESKAEEYDRGWERAEGKHPDNEDWHSHSEGKSGDYSGHSEAADSFSNYSRQEAVDIFSFARHNRVDDVERLLDRGVPVNVRDQFGNSILAVACQNGHKRVAKAVLRRGADICATNHKGNSPLHFCFAFGYGDTLGAYLISKGADEYLQNNMGMSCREGIGS